MSRRRRGLCVAYGSSGAAGKGMDDKGDGSEGGGGG